MNVILKINQDISIRIPNEIIEKIINYKISYQYTEKLKESLVLIPLQVILFKINYLYKIYNEAKGLNIPDFYDDIILEFTSYDERMKMITILNTCQCCNDHQINKPTLKQFLEGFVPNYSTKFQKNKKCKCKCRSFCRDLCRAQNDEIDESI